jgi:hypothetical protein
MRSFSTTTAAPHERVQGRWIGAEEQEEKEDEVAELEAEGPALQEKHGLVGWDQEIGREEVRVVGGVGGNKEAAWAMRARVV